MTLEDLKLPNLEGLDLRTDTDTTGAAPRKIREEAAFQCLPEKGLKGSKRTIQIMKACHLLQGNSNSDAMGTTHFFHSKNDDSYGRAHWCPAGPIGAPTLSHTPPSTIAAGPNGPRRSESLLCGASICREGCQENDGDCQAWNFSLHRSCRTARTASSVTREVEIKGLIWNGTFGHGFCGSFKAKFQELSQNREALFAFELNLRGGPFILRLLPIWS